MQYKTGRFYVELHYKTVMSQAYVFVKDFAELEVARRCFTRVKETMKTGDPMYEIRLWNGKYTLIEKHEVDSFM